MASPMYFMAGAADIGKFVMLDGNHTQSFTIGQKSLFFLVIFAMSCLVTTLLYLDEVASIRSAVLPGFSHEAYRDLSRAFI